MSMEKAKRKCSVCQAYLFDDDDVVFCPVCGAPHHRDCYNSVGHCGLEDKHGTPEQYDSSTEPEVKEPPVNYKDTRKKCAMCGEVYDSSLNCCPNCNTPDSAHLGRMSINIDFLGGVPADLDLGEGVVADEAKRFVMVNTHRYIPKFAANKIGKKASFNWLAFFFPCGWFLSRKMYKTGAFVGVLDIAISMLMYPFVNALDAVLPENMGNVNQLWDVVASNIDTIGLPAIITAAVAAVLILVLKIVCSVFGDYFYRNHCISTIKSIKTDSEDIEEDFRKKGGVSIFLFLIGVLAVDYLPQILSAFFM